MESLSQAYRTLGDATRLRILRLIAQTPLNVSELVSLVGIAQPSVSHHLGKLKAMKLLREDRQNGFTYYALGVAKDDPRWPLVRVAIEEKGDSDGDLARLQDLLRRGGCPRPASCSRSTAGCSSSSCFRTASNGSASASDTAGWASSRRSSPSLSNPKDSAASVRKCCLVGAGRSAPSCFALRHLR